MPVHWSFQQILEAVYVGFQSGVPCDVTAHLVGSTVVFILNTSRKKGSSMPCKQHLGADAAKAFWMALVSSSTHWSIAISSGLPDFLGSVSEASLECCPICRF
jgi:hypothetical protein